MTREATLGIDHVALKSQDIRRDADWYCENFGCRIEYIDDTWASLEAPGGGRIALVTPTEHPAHVAFLQRGSPTDVRVHRDGTSSRYLRDPSGNFVELLWRPGIG